MNDNMMEKQVIILHPCRFTRQGIRNLLYSMYRIFDTEDLETCKRWLLTRGPTDLVIISLQGGNYSMVGVLNLIGVLCHEHANCRILVMSSTQKHPGLGNYLAQYGNQVKVIELGSRLPVLARQLKSMVHNDEPPVQPEDICFDERYPESLSALELQVLEALLTGEKARNVATQLSLNEKAFSYYKRRALAKLGMNTVHSLLT